MKLPFASIVPVATGWLPRLITKVPGCGVENWKSSVPEGGTAQPGGGGGCGFVYCPVPVTLPLL